VNDVQDLECKVHLVGFDEFDGWNSHYVYSLCTSFHEKTIKTYIRRIFLAAKKNQAEILKGRGNRKKDAVPSAEDDSKSWRQSLLSRMQTFQHAGPLVPLVSNRRRILTVARKKSVPLHNRLHYVRRFTYSRWKGIEVPPEVDWVYIVCYRL